MTEPNAQSDSPETPPEVPAVPPVLYPPVPPVFVPSVLNYLSPRPFRPRVWTVYVIYLIAMAGIIGVGLVVGAAIAALYFHPGMTLSDIERIIAQHLLTPAVLLPLGLTNACVLLGLATLPTWWSHRHVRPRIDLVAPRGPVWVSVFAGLMGMGGGLLFQGFLLFLQAARVPFPESPTLKLFEKGLQDLRGPSMAAVLLVIGLVAPVAEEVMFRGYLQKRLVERHGPRWGVLIAAVLFGIMHLDLVQGFFAVGLGLYLGYLTLRTGSIVPAILAHAANNTLQCLLGFAQADVPLRAWAALAALSAAGLLAGVALLHWTTPPRPLVVGECWPR